MFRIFKFFLENDFPEAAAALEKEKIVVLAEDDALITYGCDAENNGDIL